MESLRGYTWVWEEIDEDSSNVQTRNHIARNLVMYVKRNLSKKKNGIEQKKKKLDNARKLRGIHYIDREDKEFNET